MRDTMKFIIGIIISAVIGTVFMFLSGASLMFMNADVVFFIITPAISFFSSLIISLIFPAKKFWVYSLSFALPYLLIGFFSGLALETFFTLGIISLIFGVLGAYIVFSKRNKNN